VLPFISGAASVNAAQVVNNSGVSDHHAIIPTPSMPKADLASLPTGERNILYLLAVRLLCAVGEKHTFAETVITADCETHSFTAKGKTILAEGWKAHDNAFCASLKEKPEKDGEDTALPDLTEGQTFPNIRASVKEGFTAPPRRFTEDSLLAAMEAAGSEDMPDDAERKGLGTPATRAGIIEKLVKSGFVERKQKNLIPTAKGVNLVTVLPEALKSPALTAEWEQRLKEVERGTLSPDAFMTGIAEFTTAIIHENSEPYPAYLALFPPPTPKGDAIGNCPRCGQPVREGKAGFFCDNRACAFALWKDNRFFAAKKKTLDKKIAAALLKEGRVFMSGLFSEKTGKTYDATILLDDTGGKYVNFKLEFQSGGGK
jgi:DNA topoisomerase-3